MANGQDQSLATPAAPKHPSFLRVFPSIVLPMFLAVVDRTIVATALPAIAGHDGARSSARPGYADIGLSAAQRAAILDDIAVAFRAAFLPMAVFTAGGFFLALTNPLRRI